MRVLFVAVDHCSEVSHCLLVILDHLVGLCPLVHIPDIGGSPLHATSVWPDRLLELLDTAVSQPYMVVNVSLNTNVR